MKIVFRRRVCQISNVIFQEISNTPNSNAAHDIFCSKYWIFGVDIDFDIGVDFAPPRCALFWVSSLNRETTVFFCLDASFSKSCRTHHWAFLHQLCHYTLHLLHLFFISNNRSILKSIEIRSPISKFNL